MQYAGKGDIKMPRNITQDVEPTSRAIAAEEELATLREENEKLSKLVEHYKYEADGLNPGFPGYKADELGNIWSVEYNWRGYGERILTPYIDKNGYYKVRLSIDGKRIKKTVHRLVCMAFYGEPECNKNIVRHLNGNKKDNTPANLCWGTQQENEADSIRLGEKACGINNGAVKFRPKVS